MKQGRKRRVPSREDLAECVKGRAALLTSENSLQNSWNPNFLMYCCCRIEPKLVGVGSLLAHCGSRVSNFTWSLEYQSPKLISSPKVLISCLSGWSSREFRSSPQTETSQGGGWGISLWYHWLSQSTWKITYVCIMEVIRSGWVGGFGSGGALVLSQLWLVSYTCSVPRFCKCWVALTLAVWCKVRKRVWKWRGRRSSGGKP